MRNDDQRFRPGIDRVAGRPTIPPTEFEQAAIDLAKAFMKIDDNDFINSYEANDEAACAHLKGIAREAAGTIRRLSSLNGESHAD